MTQLPSVY